MTTPQYLPYGTPVSGSNAQAWAQQILADLGAPQTAADIQSLMDWFDREGGGGVNNPLNTTLRTSGSTGSINSAGVQSYSSPQAGASADAATISSGTYPNILADLKSGVGLIGQPNIAGELQTWSGGGYSSVYGSPSVNPSTPPSNAQTTSFSLNPLSVFQSFGNFFTDLTSADMWERIALMFFGFFLIGVGLIILASGPTLQALGITARVGRGARSIGRTFGASSSSGGPTPEEQADRSRRLELAEFNAQTGRQKVENVRLREARLSNARPVRHRETEPNPEPLHE